MKLLTSRVFPLSLAVGVWFAGNAWIPGSIVFMAHPAYAQENPQGQECTVDPNPTPIILSKCSSITSTGSCGGICDVLLVTTYSCKPTSEPWGQFPCTNGNGNGTYQEYRSGCAIQGTTPIPSVICACTQSQPVGISGTAKGYGCVGASGV
jgi:hypothetical protein